MEAGVRGFFAPLARRRVHALRESALLRGGGAYADGSGLAVSTITSHAHVVFPR